MARRTLQPVARAYWRRAEALAKEGYGEFCIPTYSDIQRGGAGSFTVWSEEALEREATPLIETKI